MSSQPMREQHGRPILDTVVVGSDTDGRVVVRLVGELDISSADLVREGVIRCLDQRPEALSLDLSALTFCDVRGLHTLQWAARQAEAARVAFRIVAADDWMLHLFTLAEADDLLAASGEPDRPSAANSAEDG